MQKHRNRRTLTSARATLAAATGTHALGNVAPRRQAGGPMSGRAAR